MKLQHIAASSVWLLALAKCEAAEPFLTIDGYDGLGTDSDMTPASFAIISKEK